MNNKYKQLLMNIKQKRVEGERFNYSVTSSTKCQHHSITVWDKFHQQIAISLVFHNGQIRIFRITEDEYTPLCVKLIKAFLKRKVHEEWKLKLNTTNLYG